MTPLSDLIARVEGLEGPDREVDRAVAIAAGDQVSDDGISGFIWRPPGPGGWSEIPRLTASLDAALALVDRVLPTITRDEPYGPWEWRVHGPNRNDAGACRACLTWPQTIAGAHVYMVGPAYGQTPALALLCALLKALAAKEPS